MCVRQFPTLSSDTVELVGFDCCGHPKIRLQLPRTEEIPKWEKILMRWLRKKQRDCPLMSKKLTKESADVAPRTGIRLVL